MTLEHRTKNIEHSRLGFTLIRTWLRQNLVSVHAFTLIELLVVISVIGILATLILARFGSVEQMARDTQRKSDLNQYRVALEAYAGQNGGIYPHNTDGNVYGGLIAGGSDPKLCQDNDPPMVPSTWVGGLYPYLHDTCLSDPNPGGSDSTCGQSATSKYRIYCYGSDSAGMNYVLTVRLETGGFWEVCSVGKSGVVPNDEVVVSELQRGECHVP